MLEPTVSSIPEAIERAASKWPLEEFIVQGEERIGFAAMRVQVARCAAGLAAIGIGRGDHVGICLPNTADWVALFLAAASLGAVTVPVNTRLKAAEIVYTIGQSDVSCLFVVDRFLGIDFIAMLREVCPGIDSALPDPALPRLSRVVVLGEDVPAGCLGFAEFLADGRAEATPTGAAEDACLIQYTSGTTSFPKGAMLSQCSVMWDAHYAGAAAGLLAGDRHLSPRPFFHVAGSVLSVLTSLVQGTTLVTMTRFDGPSALKLAETERCTHISGNDTMFLMMLHAPDLRARRLTARGGMAACSPPVMRRVIEELGIDGAVTGYGLSESAPNVGFGRWDDPAEDRIESWARPHPGLEVRITDFATGEALADGQPGQIRVRGWSLMLCYYNKPEETEAALGDGWLCTGDVGVRRADGKFRFLGRVKEIIRVGGENVAPADIENVLHQHPAIAQAQAVGVPDARMIEVPAAFVTLRPGAAATADEILAWCRPRMANFKVPRYVRVVDGFEAIGMTASSKIQKSRLSAHARKLFGLEGS
ncbi:MAG: AMP-binding protein [Acetobacteraceae bacterium]